MSSYDLSEIIKKWELEHLSAEQTIGQILLQLQALSERVGAVERRLENMRRSDAKGSDPEAK